MILLIDNYDSFVHNLARYLRRLGQTTHVVRNDRITLAEIRELAPRAIVLSPGPCSPNEAGISLDVVRAFHSTIPMLGVCLGHQTIAQAFGGRIERASEPMHGRSSPVWHHSAGLFRGLPAPFTVGRYHSLVVAQSPWPAPLQLTAWTADRTVMAFEHRDFPVYGVQFHPESVLTECGFELLTNFLRLARLETPIAIPTRNEECPTDVPPAFSLPDRPVTF
ncbi:MAG: aminodeoxychorismate/anthranilate synthase component II [Pirellulales bacterium]